MSSDDPDLQGRLANERTLLAYQRTGLALLVSGLAVAGSRSAADVPIWFAVLGLPLVVLGGIVAIEGRTRFEHAQRAIESGGQLPPSRIVGLLPYGIAAVAVGALVSGVIQLFVGGR